MTGGEMNGRTKGEFDPALERDKLEALGRLSCRVAHNLNNILGAIEGYATLAIGGLKKDDPVISDLREIRGLVAEAAALGKQLIVFGGRQRLTKAPCGVNEIIANTLKRPELAPDGYFQAEALLEPGLPAIAADAAQLELALANLLLNAREAMAASGARPGGGKAVISAAALRLEGEGGAIKVPDPAAAGGLFIKISVRDSGPGISAEVFERLFEPQFLNKEKSHGRGLGLSLVYGIVKQHNGWLEVKSGPGQGSEFTLFLPALDRAPAAPGKI